MFKPSVFQKSGHSLIPSYIYFTTVVQAEAINRRRFVTLGVMIVLGIESSCDETAAAVVEDGYKLRSNAVLSSMDLQAAYGGVVPEIAARSHIEAINVVIEQALEQASCTW